jgi:hypothetical protein
MKKEKRIEEWVEEGSGSGTDGTKCIDALTGAVGIFSLLYAHAKRITSNV